MTPVSVVMLTHNRAGELLRSVAATLALPERPPLVVVDNASTDDSVALLARRHPSVDVVRAPANLGAAARNLGVARVRTPYVAFSDDDTAWMPGSLAAATRLLDDDARLAAVTARVIVGPERREDPVSALMSRSPLPSRGLPGRALLGFLAGASVFRRRAFLEAGGYEPRFFLGGEETLLAYDLAAAGWRMLYCPRLTVHHLPSPHRDAPGRRRLLARNALWVAWLRRPLPVALEHSRRFLREADSWGTVATALRGVPWCVRNRRVLPRHVEGWCRRIDAQARRASASVSPRRLASEKSSTR